MQSVVWFSFLTNTNTRRKKLLNADARAYYTRSSKLHEFYVLISFPCLKNLPFTAKGKTVDANQEMLALGLCNIFGSFSRSMPTTGSFTRTAVNNASGVKTPMGGVITGCLVLLACGLLTSTFEFIPKATLAAVIIVAMYYMLELHIFIVLWRTKSKDPIKKKKKKKKEIPISFLTSPKDWKALRTSFANRVTLPWKISIKPREQTRRPLKDEEDEKENRRNSRMFEATISVLHEISGEFDISTIARVLGSSFDLFPQMSTDEQNVAGESRRLVAAKWNDVPPTTSPAPACLPL